jgi:hypothetical protein
MAAAANKRYNTVINGAWLAVLKKSAVVRAVFVFYVCA